MRIDLIKYQALGNDYLVLDLPADLDRLVALLPKLCDRHHGLGSDGLLAFDPEAMSVRVFNPDGSEAQKSGNGLRITAAHAVMEHGAGDTFELSTIGGPNPVRVLARNGAEVVSELDIGRPSFRAADLPARFDGEPGRVSLDTPAGRVEAMLVSVGNPHCVVFGEPVTKQRCMELGPHLENHNAFPDRTNVQLCEVVDHARARAEIWERGAGYTLASGTSSCAVAAAAHRKGLVDRDVSVSMPGGELAQRAQTDSKDSLDFLVGSKAELGSIKRRAFGELVKLSRMLVGITLLADDFNGAADLDEVLASLRKERDTLLADVAWTRSLSERLSLNVDVASTRVLYGESVSYTTLTDYRYTSAVGALSWNTSERTALTIQGSIGDYQALDGTTQSLNSNLQLGFKRQFNELWSASLSAGTSRESDKIKTPFETLESNESGSVYAANITRQARLLTLTAQASRSLIPSGYAFLSRQESYQISASYPRSERWTFGGYARWLRSKNPQFSGPAIDQSYVDVGLSAVWLFTEHWTVTLLASYVTTDVSPPQHHAEASGCSIQLARHFNRIEWH